MRFDLNTIKRGDHDKVDLNFVVNLDNIDYHGDVLKMIKPVSVMGSLYNVGTKTFLTCQLETELEVHCSRCLKPFVYQLRSNINVELIEEDEIINEDDIDDIISYNDNIIDFNEIIREQIIMNLPMKMICSEGCKGLCKNCGMDLNNEVCRCNIDHDDVDPRLAKLKELLQQD